MLREVLKHIEQRERFLLTSHARPDGDAVGSALACCQILHSMGKEADVVLRDGVPRVYRPLPFADRVVQSARVNGEYEAAIILEFDSENAPLGRSPLQFASRGTARLNLGDAGANGTLRREGRGLRRPGELRSCHSGCGSSRFFP